MRFLLIVLLASCASRPSFQKFNGTHGYTITPSQSPGHFTVEVKLPANTKRSYLREYAWLATGVECQARNFLYFEISSATENSFHGLCHQDASVRSLLINFEKEGLLRTPPAFIVEEVTSKASTKIKSADELLEVDGKKIKSVLQLKLLAQSAPAKKTHVAIKLRRNKKMLTVQEPIGKIPRQFSSVQEIEAFVPKEP